MNLAKSYDFFNPDEHDVSISIIGCGAIGSTVAENLARFGIKNFVLFDDDVVTSHNVANQMFTQNHIGMKKVDALENIIKEINPEANVRKFDEKYEDKRVSGVVCLCVDNIDTRRNITKTLRQFNRILGVFDWRMGLTDAQHYAADWTNEKQINNLIRSMDFSHEEAQILTPVSACNMTLSVNPTVRTICALGVSNIINFLKEKTLKQFVYCNPFEFAVD